MYLYIYILYENIFKLFTLPKLYKIWFCNESTNSSFGAKGCQILIKIQIFQEFEPRDTALRTFGR